APGPAAAGAPDLRGFLDAKQPQTCPSAASEPLDLGGLELAPPAGLEPLQRQPCIGAPMQLPHRVADGREHPLHLVLAALVDRQLDAAGAEAAGARRGAAAVVEVDAALEALERRTARVALDVGDVDLVHFVTRVREPVRELAVVREQERACRVDV